MTLVFCIPNSPEKITFVAQMSEGDYLEIAKMLKDFTKVTKMLQDFTKVAQNVNSSAPQILHLII